MQGAIKRLLRKVGDEVRLYQYEGTGSSSYGTGYQLVDPDGTPLQAIPDPSGKSLGVDALFGTEVDADMVFLVGSDYAIDGGGGEGASRIVHAGRVYVVVGTDPSLASTHGLQVLECERDSETNLLERDANG